MRAAIISFITAFIMPLVASADAGQTDASPRPATRRYYNISCINKNLEIMINTYRHEVGLRNDLSSQQITALETVLITPGNSDCQECVDITATSDRDDFLYLIQLRKNSEYFVKIFNIEDNKKYIPLVPKTSCSINSDFQE